MESVSLSSIEGASFFQGLQRRNGNPLHSTAIEEDMNASEGGGLAAATGDARGSTTGKHMRASGKRKERETKTKEDRENKKPRKSPVKADGASNRVKQAAGKKVGTGRIGGQRSSASTVKDAQRRKEDKPRNEICSAPSAQELSDQPDRDQRELSSSDGEGLDDPSWRASPKKAPALGLARSRKSSSDARRTRKSSSDAPRSRKSSSDAPRSRKSSSDTPKRSTLGDGDHASESGAPAKSGKMVESQKRQRKRGREASTELEVVLDAFSAFCDQYRESVESAAIKSAIESFSSSVEEQLLEKITSSKELGALRRGNAKVNSLIRKKREKLLGAKDQLIRAERRLLSLQKEEARLQQRLTDVRQARAFTRHLGLLGTQHGDAHAQRPHRKAEYGASSLPALLFETQLFLDAEEKQQA